MGDLVVRSDDGVTLVVDEIENGKVICTSRSLSPQHPNFGQAEAEQAAVQVRREVLQAVVDPKRATPPAEDVLQAQAFLALAELDGVKAALDIAGEAIVVDPVPVDPKGGVRGVLHP